MAVEAKRPEMAITWLGSDVTARIIEDVLECRFDEALEEESDTLTLRLADHAGRWRADWWPQAGDEIACALGYQGEALMACGQFVIDRVSHSGPPDVIEVSALAAEITTSLRTERSQGHEETDLASVAAVVAARHGLEVVGDIEPWKIGRITQDRESDLRFLARLARDFGYVFSVRGRKLVFHDLAKLHALGPAMTVTREELLSWRLTRKMDDTPVAVRCDYWDAGKKELHSYRLELPEGRADEMKLSGRAENLGQARRRVLAAATRARAGLIEGEIEMIGNTGLRCGMNIELAGMGAMDGRFRVDRTSHRIDRAGGYVTTATLAMLPEGG